MAAITKQMSFDFDGLIQLLAGHLYSEKKVFIRELIQNAHDGIVRRVAADPSFSRDQGHIDILTDLTATPARIVFRDNGVGMTQDDLEKFLSTLGRSGTRIAREQVPEVIGQFGIGFLSGFVVGARVEVRTRHWQVSVEQARLWKNSGNKDYTIEPCAREEVGTEVTVFLRSAADRGLLHDDAVKNVVRQYADMLRVPIRLNDPGHHRAAINSMIMPWERHGSSEAEVRLDSMVYLEKRVPDSVLEVIPVRVDPSEAGDGSEPPLHAEGLLYITRTRVIVRDAPRTVRVFLHRMFLCEEAKELLPPWATFVNGIINTSSLTPNAARDNFARDANYTRLRERLGDIIVAHFEHLREQEPSRLSQILAYHDLGIKAACYYHEPFFEKFGHLLEWRINAKSPAARSGSRAGGRRVVVPGVDANQSWATLPDIVESLPQAADGEPKRLSCFSASSSANQFFEMADAAGTTVVDASFPFESQLIARWAERSPTSLKIVHVDREDDPAVFLDADPVADRSVHVLAQRMSLHIAPGGTGRLRVEARHFSPTSLPAVLKTSEAGQGSVKARDILNDPNAPADLRAMAEQMLQLSRNADMRMSINATNPLIRTLASLVVDDPDDEDLRDLMLGVYNDAILYNQELMTPHNAKIFHEQFQRLMRKSVEFLRQKQELARGRAELDALRRTNTTEPRTRTHLKGFLMTPFADTFDDVRNAVREVVEVRLGCELQSADQRTFADLIRGNVGAHLEDADLYVADVTGANPNVMLELGGVLYARAMRPTVLIAGVARRGDKPQLPVDLEGSVTGCYVTGASPADIADQLEDVFRKHERLARLLEREDRETYVSPATLREWTRDLLRGKGAYSRLSEALPTVSTWAKVERAQLEDLLGEERDLVDVLILRVEARL